MRFYLVLEGELEIVHPDAAPKSADMPVSVLVADDQ